MYLVVVVVVFARGYSKFTYLFAIFITANLSCFDLFRINFDLAFSSSTRNSVPLVLSLLLVIIPK